MTFLTSRLRFDGKTALVAGGGSGIGRATCHALAELGGNVFCADINDANASAVANEIASAGGRCEVLHLDITNKESVRAGVEGVCKRTGRIDVLVTTPAVNVRKRLLEYTDEEFDKVIGLNLKGNFLLVREAGREMSKSGGGSIVVLSSIRSLVVEPGQGVYAMTKAGLVQMVRGFAAELAARGVRVNAVAPGVVDTPLTAPIKAKKDWYDAYSSQRGPDQPQCLGPLGARRRNRSAHRFSGFRCKQLHHGNSPLRGWRLDCDRWAIRTSTLSPSMAAHLPFNFQVSFNP